MAKVDPFVIPIPQGLDPELQTYFRNLDRFLKSLRTRTGDSDDLVEKSDVALATARFQGHEHPLDDIDNLHFGIGVPEVKIGNDGDFYFRSDGGLNTRIYHKGSGTWTAIT